MSFKLKYQSGSPVIVSMYAYATVEKDEVVAIDTTNKGVIPATASSTSLTILGVCQEEVTADGSARCRVILFEPGQIWEAATDVNTLSTHEAIHHVLANSKSVTLTTNNDTSTAGVALMLRRVGATGDKLAEFQIMKAGQTTA